MKRLPILALAALLSPCGAVDFIRQIQLIEGQTIVYDMPVSGNTGSVMSKPLEGDGAVFQLYAFDDDDYDPWSLLDLNAGSDVHANVSLDSHLVDLDLLGIDVDILLGSPGEDDPLPQRIDEMAVGIHLPATVVTLGSEDPYKPVRTRADRPYSFSLSVQGLANPEDPLGGISRITVDREFKIYHPDLHTPFPNGTGQGAYDSAYQFIRNGDFRDPRVYAALPAARPTKSIGEESFVARVELGDSGKQVVTGSATIQIWPVCDAAIEGIVPGKRYMGIPSEARVVLKDLYPDSVTYAQIYAGGASLGRVGKVIASSAISFNTYAPQNAVVPLVMSGVEIGEDGIYTIEVLTVTPFNDRKPERMAHVSFEVDRTIEVRGTLSNSE